MKDFKAFPISAPSAAPAVRRAQWEVSGRRRLILSEISFPSPFNWMAEFSAAKTIPWLFCATIICDIFTPPLIKRYVSSEEISIEKI
jgi:hypothetical protein